VTASKSGAVGSQTISIKVTGRTNGLGITVNLSGDKSGSFTVSQAAGSGSNTYTFDVGYSTTRQVCAIVTDGHTTSGRVCDSATSDAKPAPVLSASPGTSHQLPDSMGTPGYCTNSTCAWGHLTITGAAPNTSFTVTCYGGGSKIGSGGYTHEVGGGALKTDGNGNYSGDQMCVYGQPGGDFYIVTSIGTTNHISWS
jgi:hypothetical protein